MRPCFRLLTCLCFLVATAVTTASATQVAHLSAQQLGQQSEIVLRGRVVNVESQWNGKHTKIFTTTRIAVDETYKGAPWGVVDVIQLGGTVGTVKVTVQGALQWKVGEEVLLFAEQYELGTFQVSGFSQGKFRIIRDEKTGTAYVQAPPTEGTVLLGAPSAPDQTQRSGVELVPLEVFVNQALDRR